MKKIHITNLIVILIIIICIILVPLFFMLFINAQNIFVMNIAFLLTSASIGGIAVCLGYLICSIMEYCSAKKNKDNSQNFKNNLM